MLRAPVTGGCIAIHYYITFYSFNYVHWAFVEYFLKVSLRVSGVFQGHFAPGGWVPDAACCAIFSAIYARAWFSAPWLHHAVAGPLASLPFDVRLWSGQADQSVPHLVGANRYRECLCVRDRECLCVWSFNRHSYIKLMYFSMYILTGHFPEL